MTSLIKCIVTLETLTSLVVRDFLGRSSIISCLFVAVFVYFQEIDSLARSQYIYMLILLY